MKGVWGVDCETAAGSLFRDAIMDPIAFFSITLHLIGLTYSDPFPNESHSLYLNAAKGGNQ